MSKCIRQLANSQSLKFSTISDSVLGILTCQTFGRGRFAQAAPLCEHRRLSVRNNVVTTSSRLSASVRASINARLLRERVQHARLAKDRLQTADNRRRIVVDVAERCARRAIARGGAYIAVIEKDPVVRETLDLRCAFLTGCWPKSAEACRLYRRSAFRSC